MHETDKPQLLRKQILKRAPLKTDYGHKNILMKKQTLKRLRKAEIADDDTPQLSKVSFANSFFLEG